MLLVLRFVGGATIGIFLYFAYNSSSKSPNDQRHIFFKEFKHAFWPGLYLGLTLVLQTWGLLYTTATKSGFITTTYIAIVPLLSFWIYKTRFSLLHSVSVILALIGTALMVNLRWTDSNIGDLLTLACAFAGAAHILSIDHTSSKTSNSSLLNTMQTLWAAVLVLILLPISKYFGIPLTKELSASQELFGLNSIGSVLFLILGPTTLAFSIQIRAQKVLSPHLASILFLLESPFAFLFAVLFLKESLSLLQLMGCGLIIVSGAIAIEANRIKK